MKTTPLPIWSLLLCVLLVFAPTRGLAATINWTNLSGGMWNVAENWNPQQVPGAADTALIAASGTYTVTLDVDSIIAGLTLGGSSGKQTLSLDSHSVSLTGSSTIGTNGVLQQGGGTLTSGGLLTLQGLLMWSAGKIQGSVSISSSGLLDMTTSADHEFIGSLTNAGAVHWSGGRLYLENQSTFANLASATFDAQSDLQLFPAGTSPNLFINQGTFRKSAGLGSLNIDLEFINSGAVQVQSGVLRFNQGFVNSGSFNISQEARLELAAGTYTLNPGYSITGNGFYGVTGDVTLIGDITPSNFQFIGGNLRGTNRLTGTLNWSSAGIMRNVLTVAPSGILNLLAGNDHEWVGALTNAGTVHWSGGRFFLEDQSTFVNLAGATFDAQLDSQLIPAGASQNLFINQGTFRKSAGLGSLNIDLEFINTGAVQVQSGVLRFSKGFVNSGSFNISQEARLELAAGTYTLNPGYSITGNGFYGVTGDVTLIGDITPSNFQLIGGNLRGTNRLTGTLNWSTGGIMRNVLTVAPSGILNLLAGNDHEWVGALTNAGTVHWSGGRFFLEDQSTFVNLAGATFDAQLDSQLIPAGTSPNLFINQGTFRKSAGLDSLSIDLDVINTGAVQVQSGVLRFSKGFVNSGSFNISQEARLELAAGTYTLNPGYSITGNGFYGVTGDVTLIGDITPSNFQLIGGNLRGTNRLTGTLNWSLGGIMRNVLTVAPSGILNLLAGNDHEWVGALTNAGTVHWSGGRFYLEDQSTVVNLAGATFDAQLDSQLIPAGTSPNLFINQGIFRKSAGSGNTGIETIFNNTGTVEVQTGTLAFSGSFTQTAGSTLLQGGNLSSVAPFEIQGGILGGNGSVTATVNNAGQVNPGTSPGLLNIIGDYNQTEAGILNIEVAGLTPDAFDRVTVSGTATLNGLLNSPLVNGFAPPTNSAFAFLTAGTRNGQFSRHTFTSNQVELIVNYTPNAASLQVVNVFTNVSKFPPVLGVITHRTVNELAQLQFTATATDADVPTNILSFRLDSAPPGASIDPRTGVFTWTPTEDQGPGSYPVVVRVTDNGSLFDTQTFTVTVKEVNQAPVLTPIPGRLIAPGRTLQFTAVATDPDTPAQTLTFSLGAGAPPSASINESSGLFTWAVPVSQPAGKTNVIVRVTDNAENPLSASQGVVIEVDRNGPRITTMDPTGSISNTVDHVDVTFDKAIDPASFDAVDVELTGSKGLLSTAVQPVNGNTYRISFASLLPGNYTVRIGPNIMDVAGNLMNQDTDGTNGEPQQDAFTGQISIRLADLMVTQITLPATALLSQPIPILWTVTNQGTSAALGPWTDFAVLIDKTHPGSEALLASFTYTNILLAGQSITRTQSAILPTGWFGTSSVVFHTDALNQVPEGPNETNNVTEASLPIQILAPDLVVTAVTVPSSAQFGQTLNVSWTVQNAGTASAQGGWSDSLYLAAESNSLAGATLLVSHPNPADSTLAIGANYTRTQSATLPLNALLTPGNYFIVVATDSGGSLPESIEENNLESRSLSLTPAPLPDLAVRDLQAPATAQPGQTIELRWTVTNQGNIEASAPWTETISISNQPPLLSLVYSNTLAAGASLTRTQAVTLPASGAAGSLRFSVEIDSAQEVFESNETNNLTLANSPTTVPTLLTLAVPVDQIGENAPDPTITGNVTRNGSPDNPLTVSLASNKKSELTVPATVTIPAGQVTASFEITVHRDGIVDGPQRVTISAAANDFTGASAPITVLDADLPNLILLPPQTNMLEGTTINATVKRDLVTAGALVVQLSSSDDLQLRVPETITIPANQASTSFALTAVDDTLIEAPRIYTVKAAATGFNSDAASIEITDDDIPHLTVQLAANEVSEGAGATATSGTVTRDIRGPRALVVALESSNENAARIPSTVTLPAGAVSVSFPVAAVDNKLIDGKKTAFIRAYPTDSQTHARLTAGTPAELSVLDDDGPTLRLEIALGLVAEGLSPATTATVTRNSSTASSLIVTLASSALTEATVPATVTIPPGQASLTFPISSVNDGVTDGDKTVTLTASAAGFTQGSAQLVVTDRNLPDLVVASVTVPASGATESQFEISYRVANNGTAASTRSILQRVYLSTDAVMGDDVLLGQAEFSGAVPPGQHFDQTFSLRLPQKTGNYWIVVATDSDNAVAEALENNNATISAQPIRVEKTYGATVKTDVEVALAGTSVPLSGQATLVATGKPAPFTPVNIHIQLRDTERIIAAITDAEGRYTTLFKPLPGEAGSYLVGADHPGVSQTPVQDSFTLLGLRITPPAGVLRVIEGGTLIGSAKVENLSDIPLNGLAAVVVSKPAHLQVNLKLTNSLPGEGEGTLEFSITPSDTSIRQGIVVIRISNSAGVSADFQLPVITELLRPRLAADPGSLVAGMKRGSQTTLQFEVTNTGGAESGELSILPPAIPWLKVASGGRVRSLQPGESNNITLVLTPPADLTLGDHQGTIVISSAAASLTVPFNLRALSTLAGDLKISAVDEYTYYAEGSPPITNATVTVADQLTGNLVASGLSDSRGELIITNLPEAYYQIDVRADGHSHFRSTSLLAAGKMNEVLAFLNRETVRYVFTVVPTEIEDRTKIVIETVFETVVPIPVITVEPMLIDLADFKEEVMQVDFKISNQGLVAADNTRLVFENHPEILVTPLVTNVGRLQAKSSLTIPAIIRRLSSAPSDASTGRPRQLAAGAGGGCDLRGDTFWDLLCGPTKQTYTTPIQIKNAGRGCGGSGGGRIEISGGFSGYNLRGPGGAGSEPHGGGGGAYVGPSEVRSPLPCNPCFRSVTFNLADCASNFLLPNFANCIKSLGQCGIGIHSPGDHLDRADTATDCTGFVVNCIATGAAEAAVKGFKTPLNIASCILNGLDAISSCVGGGGASKGATKARLESERQEVGTKSIESSIARPELEPLKMQLARLQTLVNLESNLFGSTVWLDADPGPKSAWLNAFATRIAKDSDASRRLSLTEQSELGALALPAPVTAADVTAFIERWNRTMDYWQVGRFDSTDVTAGQNPAFLALDILQTLLNAATNAIDGSEADGFKSIGEGIESARQDLVHFYEQPSGGDCATVRLRIEQQAVITRDAFNASLEVVNSTAGPLEEVLVELSVRNEIGEITTSQFGIRSPQLSGLSAVDGTGVIGANSTGKASWILIPTSEAAPLGPTVMLVSGTLKYRQDGALIKIPLLPASITVLPNASLKIKYFNQRDVFADDPFTPEIEPSIPFSLGVLIQNAGHGAARNVRITSAQPKIIDNAKGLLIDFEIIATEIAGESLSPSLTANFGNIGPGEVAVGRWLMRSSLQGLFTDYKASFEHLDGLGDPRLSLIDSVEIHELNHLVRADSPSDDGKPDFLVNDVPDLRDLPDTLHLSDGRIEPVGLVLQGAIDSPPTPGHLEVKLTAAFPAGWAYLQIADPADGQFKLAHVRRSNGSEILVGYNAWMTDRTFVGNAQRPVRENVFHLLDFNSSGTYTLVYEELAAQDHTPPTSAVEALPSNSSAQIPIRWSGNDGSGSGIDSFDIYVSINGGPFSPWLQKITLPGALYNGKQNDRYAFYSVATDRAGNPEAPHTTSDAQTTVSLVNTVPKLVVPAALLVNEGDTLVATNTATDADLPANRLTFSIDSGAPSGVVIDPDTGVLTWATGEGNGPSTNIITVRVTDNGDPRLSVAAPVKVIVHEVNQAPDFEPFAAYTLNEGKLLTVVAHASDPDIPPNPLTFRLAASAPPGATLTPGGIFTWTPTPLQGPSTNLIEVIVTDAGKPNLTATQMLTVVVRDALGDFSLGIGSTHVLAGQKGDVPIQLSPGVDLTHLKFTLDLPTSGLVNLSLRPLVSEVALSSLHPTGPGQFQIELTTGAGLVLPGGQAVAEVGFETDGGVDSATVPLHLSQIEGTRSSGTRLTKANSQSGRVIILGKQPVLEVRLDPASTLVLYGRVGASFEIEYQTNLDSRGPWTRLTRVPQTHLFETIHPLPKDPPILFFRAREFVAKPAILDARWEPGTGASLILYGEPGAAYELQSANGFLTDPGWLPEFTVSLTNSFLLIQAPRINESPRFFRTRLR